MTASVEFTVPTDAFELGQVLQVPEIQVELFQLVPCGDRFVPYLWIEMSNDFDEFKSQLTDDYRVDEVITVQEDDGARLYRINWITELNGIFAGFRKYGLSIDYAEGTAQKWRFRVFNNEHENLELFREYCDDHDIPIQIERVYHSAPSSDMPASGLTQDQQQALVTAFEQGYFDVPQDTTLEEVSEQLDISRQAAGDRIHRGVQNLISRTLLGDDSEMRS